MKVLVTGGAGYIGSVTASALERAGHTPIVLDSLERGPRAFVRDRVFYEGDLADRALLRRVVEDHPDLTTAIHMGAYVSVPESMEQPALYYDNNVAKSLVLFDELSRSGVDRVVFSSSASVYATGPEPVVTETSPTGPQSPYARTKLMMEEVLADLTAATTLRGVVLRYFNPVGANPDLSSGVHAAEPSHVLGQLVMAANGTRPRFRLTGTDFETRDGTGLRDYIPVGDLAVAHVHAVERFDEVLDDGATTRVLNLGTGTGTTVRELVAAVEEVTGLTVPVEEAPRRPGDSAGACADPSLAHQLLGWRCETTLTEAIASALEWDRRRPDVLGYR
ncbi:UDP-glucose 4-epimerase [Marmoricola sp. Leaf446]|uniref:UDP-glucose 4-epimerase GalE n=1 Tax=Marmoricola sp. Leaf446 TaxID=1736379 RepID=UPI0006FF879A|nr:UDP-glucose 4-epimerase GalE [Marmoricola sp. Leaf446]KQT93602.1 UDP-glucose 4-epimerase [Marmoricola sp. Leaf446]